MTSRPEPPARPDGPPDERALVDRALGGNADALDAVVRSVRDPVYRLALRMEWQPHDAEDATQEILIRIVTSLGSWNGTAALTTWSYRIAVNHLLNRRRTRSRRDRPTFETMAVDLDRTPAQATYNGADAAVLAEEVKLTCTQAMLQCLEPDDRLVYILGDIFRLPGKDASWIIGTSDAAYRKRLQRVRHALRAFTAGRCGLIERGATCRCERRVDRAVSSGRIRPERLTFAGHPRADAVADASREIAELHSVAALMRSHPAYAAPESLAGAIRNVLRSGQFPLLADQPAPAGAADGGSRQ